MFKILKKMSRAFRNNGPGQNYTLGNASGNTAGGQSSGNADDVKVSEKLENNESFLKYSFKNSCDIVYYPIFR